MAEHSTAPENGQETQTEETQNRKRPGKKPLIILGIVVIVMVVVALVWWLLTRNEETTDDAFTDGDAVTIAPKVAGYVTELRVKITSR
jgi:membrane fusion protein (multidrug efflux system)